MPTEWHVPDWPGNDQGSTDVHVRALRVQVLPSAGQKPMPAEVNEVISYALRFVMKSNQLLLGRNIPDKDHKRFLRIVSFSIQH
jgi:hypothetical protein